MASRKSGPATVISAPLSGSADTPTAGGGAFAATVSKILRALSRVVEARRGLLTSPAADMRRSGSRRGLRSIRFCYSECIASHGRDTGCPVHQTAAAADGVLAGGRRRDPQRLGRRWQPGPRRRRPATRQAVTVPPRRRWRSRSAASSARQTSTAAARLRRGMAHSFFMTLGSLSPPRSYHV